MDFLNSVFEVIMEAFFWGLGLLFVKSIFTSYFFSLKKKEILKIRAQIATAKLKLRNKLNLRYNDNSKFGSSDLKTIVQPLAEQITNFQFDRTEDYQLLLNTMIEINNAMRTNELLVGLEMQVNEPPKFSIAPELEAVRNAYSEIFEFDRDLVCFIVEIKNFTDQLIKRATEFNRLAKMESSAIKGVEVPEPVRIEHFNILEQFYSGYKASLESKLTDDGNNDGGSSTPQEGSNSSSLAS